MDRSAQATALQQVADGLSAFLASSIGPSPLDEAAVRALVRAELAGRVRTLEICRTGRVAARIEMAHRALPDLLTAVAAGASPLLVGPAGSGKSTLARQIAEALGLRFHMAARVTAEHKLLGFVDARGRVVRTPFRDAYEHGGDFLFDEVDASDPDVLTAFNAALANDAAIFRTGRWRAMPI